MLLLPFVWRWRTWRASTLRKNAKDEAPGALNGSYFFSANA